MGPQKLPWDGIELHYWSMALSIDNMSRQVAGAALLASSQRDLCHLQA